MMGMGMGVGFSSPPPWTPAVVPGCILYGGAYLEARAVRAAQPNLIDGNMESAGTAAYSALRSTLAKVAGAHGGTQCLEVTATVATPLAYQALLTVGNRVRSKGWVHGDGVSAPSFGDFSNLFVNGTASTDWQYLSGDWTVGNANATWGIIAGAAGSKVYFDDLQLENLSIQSYTPAFTTVAGSVLAQATPTAQPWVSSDGLGIRYQGGDMLQWSAAASNLKCLHDGTGGTLIVAVRPSVINAANWLAATFLIDPGQVGIGINYDGASVGLYIGNGTGALGTSASAALALALEQTYVFTIRTTSGANNVNMRVNSTSRITTTLNNPSAANPFFGLKFGAHTAGNAQSVNGVLGHPFVANRVLTDAECTAVENYILAQATL